MTIRRRVGEKTVVETDIRVDGGRRRPNESYPSLLSFWVSAKGCQVNTATELSDLPSCVFDNLITLDHVTMPEPYFPTRF